MTRPRPTSKDTTNAAATMNAAVAALRAGEPRKARPLLAQVARVRPTDHHVRYLQAAAALMVGEGAAALAAIDAALRLASDNGIYHGVRGQALLLLGRVADAEPDLRRALDLRPEQPEIMATLGKVLRHLGRHDAAMPCFQQALRRRPDHVEALLALGHELLERGAAAPAAACFEPAARIAPRDARVVAGLGRARAAEGRDADAEAAWREALRLDPQCADAHAYRGTALLRRGLVAEAAEAQRQAFAANPAHAAAHFQRAHLGTTHSGKEATAIRTALDRPGLSHDDRALLLFALGKALDDVSQYDAAFEAYGQGNALMWSTAGVDPHQYSAYAEQIVETFDRPMEPASPRTGPDVRPLVFIVGMPRSGTTLVEQMLARHPNVTAGGERPDMGALAEALPAAGERSGGFPAGIGNLDGRTAEGLTEKHRRQVTALVPAGHGFTDKTPANFWRLGLIARLFPEARIVHCRRDAADTCLSCFFQLFGRNNILYSYHLPTLGLYHRLYRQIMAHWRDVLPIPILDVDYETLVADPEPEIRRLLAFLGFAWDDACLDFHRGGGRVGTASAAQVRRPIYTASVGRWRSYEPHLGPLLQALEEERKT